MITVEVAERGDQFDMSSGELFERFSLKVQGMLRSAAWPHINALNTNLRRVIKYTAVAYN